MNQLQKMKKTLVTILCLLFFLEIQAQEEVTRIIDGDTFEISTGEKIRLIGINAPEMKDKYGLESKKYLINLIENKDVLLKTDPFTNDKDIYGRLLRYVFYGNDDVNKRIIRDGFAIAYLKYPFEKKDEYTNAELLAKSNKVGIWRGDERTTANNNNTKYYIAGSGILLLLISLIYYLRK